MENRSDGRKFLSTGRPPDKTWMESGQMRPSWREKGARSTTDSGMGSMENRYGLVPPQPGRRKRHADDGKLGGGIRILKGMWIMYSGMTHIRGYYLSRRI